MEFIQTANIEYDLSEHWGAFTEWVMFSPCGAITAQTGWVLRPFVARPEAELTFLRPIDSDVDYNWLWQANWSCSSRVIPYFSATFSPVLPMW